MPADLTTSVSTAMGRNLSALCRSVGTTFVKEPYWGQIAFTQIYLWRGGLSPFFYLEIFLRTSINIQKLLPPFLWLHLKHSSLVR